MKIFYNPYFCGIPYLDFSHSHFGEKYVNTQGLLDELELRLGTALQVGKYRVFAYRDALKKVVDKTCFCQSFQKDEIGVAQQLLQYRDLLFMVGWDGKALSGSKLVSDLSVIEQQAVADNSIPDCYGDADRWRNLSNVLTQKNPSFKDEIEVECPVCLLPVRVKAVLDAINHLAPNSVNFKDFTSATAISQSNVSIFTCEELREAYEWLANQDANDLTVICHDRVRLNTVLSSFGKSEIQARTEASDGAILQIFKLGLKLFADPMDIDTLLAFLQLQSNPLPSSLRFKLARFVAQSGGITDDWNKSIEEFKSGSSDDSSDKANEEVELSDEQLNELKDNDIIEKDATSQKLNDNRRLAKLVFISMVGKQYSDNEIPCAEICKFLKALSLWAFQYSSVEQKKGDQADQIKLTQLGQLFGFCLQLKDLLKGQKTIKADKLLELIDCVYRPAKLVTGIQRVDAFNVVDTPECIFDEAHNVVWLDCSSESPLKDDYAFLSLKEKTHFGIPSEEDKTSAARCLRYSALNNRSGQLTIINAKYDKSTMLVENPIVTTLIQNRIPSTPLTITAARAGSQPVIKFNPQVKYDLGIDCTDSGTSFNASYSSLTSLFQTPFDFLLENIGKMPEPADIQLNDLKTVKGLVAHKVVEVLAKECLNSKQKLTLNMQLAIPNKYEDTLNLAVKETGMLLLQKAYAVSFEVFKNELKDSLKVLADVIDNLKLTIAGSECEVMYPNVDGIKNGHAFVDLLLKTENDKYVVFDFKYSISKYYADLLKDNESIQMEFYKQILKVDGKEVIGCGYYLFPKQTLYTLDFQGKHIEKLQSSKNALNNLWLCMKNSYKERLDELKSGQVEEGEDMSLEVDKTTNRYLFEYLNKKTDANPLYPLKKGKKKVGGYKSGKESKHCVLKNKVK